MNQPPAFQFYVDNFIQGTCDMEPQEVGIYIRLLCYQWSNGSIPSEKGRLIRVAGGEVSEHVMAKFQKGPDGRLRNARMERERAKQFQYRSKQAEFGRKGGRPKKGSLTKPFAETKGFEKGSQSLRARVPSPSPSPEEVPNAASPPPTTHHVAFIDGWSQNFKATFGFEYQFDGGRDGKAVKELLRMQIQSIDLLEIAKDAWARGGEPPKSFVCQKASTIHGFREHLNEIRTELKNGNRPHQRINQRLVGIARSGIDYGEAARRKLERQALAAQNGTTPHSP